MAFISCVQYIGILPRYWPLIRYNVSPELIYEYTYLHKTRIIGTGSATVRATSLVPGCRIIKRSGKRLGDDLLCLHLVGHIALC